MQPKPLTRIAFALALAFVGCVSTATAASTDDYVGRLIAEDLFDKLTFSGRIAVWPVDAAQARASGVAPSAAASLADNIRAAIHHIGAARGLTFVEREAISKVFQEQQFSHNAKDSDFETLAQRANADALVVINLHRANPTQIVVSARLVGAKGEKVSQILATSRAYEVAMAEPTPSPSASASPAPAIRPHASRSSASGAAQPAPGKPLPPARSDTITPRVTPRVATVTPYGAPYAPLYAAPAASYAYPPPAYPPPYYYAAPPYAVPAASFAYMPGYYGRWGWRR